MRMCPASLHACKAAQHPQCLDVAAGTSRSFTHIAIALVALSVPGTWRTGHLYVTKSIICDLYRVCAVCLQV